MKLKIFLGLIFMSLINLNMNAWAQPDPQVKSIHQIEYEAHHHLPKMPSLFDSTGKGIYPLAKAAIVQQPSKTVFGYLPDWQYLSTRNQLQYDLLTHIAAFDFTVTANGTIYTPSYWPWTDVINAAHANGVKMILTAVNFNADDIHQLLTNSTAKQNFFDNLKNMLNQYHMDGVNIDFEGLHTEDRGTLLNNFMADLSSSIKNAIPAAEISFAGPAVNWGGWDLAGLAEACDYIFIMGYSFAGKWSTYTTANAPLTGGNYNITNTVTVQYASVTNSHPEKLILGVPYYGHRWKTSGSYAGAPITSFEESTRFTQAEKEAQNYGRIWDVSSQTPWYRYQIGTQWYQVWFDDAKSLALKYDLADQKQLKGVGMWALGYDNNRQELWNLLRQRYLPASEPQPVAPQSIFISPGEQIGQIKVALDSVYGAQGYEVFLSNDGSNFQFAKRSSQTQFVLDSLNSDQLYFLQLRTFNSHGTSPFSSVLVASTGPGDPFLLIDGFERNDGGNNTYAYLIQHGKAFFSQGATIASATNDALINSLCSLDSFKMADWMCGDESQADFTFNAREKTIVQQYLESGGNLLISGSEIGYDLVQYGSQNDRWFYANYLKADYINDAPLGKKSTYYSIQGIENTLFESAGTLTFDNGSHGTYNVDWPDAILPTNGAVLGFTFVGVNESNGGAGVYYQGTFGNSHNQSRLIYLSIPFETIYPESARNKLANLILTYFTKPLALPHEPLPVVQNFRFIQQYPNPFNGQTTFEFLLNEAATIRLQIFNLQGQLIFQKSKSFSPGKHQFHWAPTNLHNQRISSGTYFYRFQDLTRANDVLCQGKLMLVR